MTEIDNAQVVVPESMTKARRRSEDVERQIRAAEAELAGHEQEMLHRWAKEDAETATENAAALREARAADDRRLAQFLEATADECDAALRSNVLAATRAVDGKARASSRVRAIRSFERAGQYRQMASALRGGAVTVHEPDIYSRTSRYSWFADIAVRSSPGADPRLRDQAGDRLEKYGRQLAWAVGEEARHFRRTVRELGRRYGDDEARAQAEFRAMTTGSTSGGSFVVPAYAVEDYATYRSLVPAYIDNCVTMRPLPDHGMTISVPAFTAPAGVSAPAENTTPTQGTPAATYRQAAVSMFAGVVPASQQLLDRSGPLGFDSAIYAQLRDEAAQQLNIAALTAALTGVTASTRASFTVGGFLSDIGQAASTLQNTAGVALPPSAIITTPPLGEFILSQTTSAGQPVFQQMPGKGDRAEGYSGYAPSAIPLYLDANVPATGGDATILVTNDTALFMYAGEPICDAIVGSASASSLTVQFRLRWYASPVVRYPAAVKAISGAAYPTSPIWT